MYKSILARLTAISIVVTTIGYPTPAKSNPTAIIAPALCSTGVGCLFLGVVAVGGISYYLWQHNSSGQQFYVPIYDPEPEQSVESEWVTAITENDCYKIARRRGKTVVEVIPKSDVTGGTYVICRLR